MRVARLPATSGVTELEKKIFDLLLDVNEKYKLGCTLRVAGGWVRDRLLGKVSDDIDIALEGDNEGQAMTGELFSQFITKYQEEHGMETRHVGVIKVNPDQSKHLETATTHIFGEPIDLVNLRCEDYADSRIPIVRPGTPKEDASRRDLTINAMFYNLHTQNVEDFTTGLEDLENKVVRTPLEPLVTFHDDPLRLLRCVRFAARFQCEVHDDIVTAATNPEVHDSLKKKVSRERVGIEVKKMFQGPNPARCMSIFHRFNCVDVVFELCKCDKKGNIIAAESAGFTPDAWRQAIESVEALQAADPSMCLEDVFSALVAHLPTLPPNNKLEPFLHSLITHGLKLPKRTTERVLVTTVASRQFDGLWDEGEMDMRSLEEKGVVTEGAVPASKRTLLAAAMQQAVYKYDVDKQLVVEHYWKTALRVSAMRKHGNMEAAQGLITTVSNDEVLSALPDLKPLIKGNELMDALSVKGKDVRAAYERQLDMQTEYPSTGRDQMLDYLRKVL